MSSERIAGTTTPRVDVADPADRGPAEGIPTRGAYPRPIQTATAIFGYPGRAPVARGTLRAPGAGYPRPGGSGGSGEIRGRPTQPGRPPYPPPPAQSGRDSQRARFPIVLVGPGPGAEALAGAVEPVAPGAAISPGPSTAPASAPTAAAQPTGPCAGIVQREGESLTLDGRPFAFFGINVQYLLDDELPEERVEPLVAELSAKGAAVLRVWVLPKHDPARFGRLLEIGRRHGVRFVVALEDNVFHGRDWFGSDDDRSRYRPHLERTVSEFRDRPEILMWELINEPNCGERYDGDCLDTIKGWLRGRAREVEAIDACHLVTTGMIGAGNYEQDLSMYRRTHRAEEIDVLSMHKRVGESWERELAAAAELERPILLGEVYDRAYAKDCSPLEGGKVRDRRAERVVDELRDALAAGVDGYLLWAHAEGAVEQPNGTLRYFCGEFDYEIDDPLWEHLADRADLPPPVPWRAAP